jgi:hypothetical protein
MHASIDHLLSLRDGEPADAATAAHVAECARCSAELRKLRETRAQLQSLPQLDAPSSFQEIQRAMARPVTARRRVVSARLVAALAFVSLTTIFFIALRDQTEPPFAGRKVERSNTRTRRRMSSRPHACRSWSHGRSSSKVCCRSFRCGRASSACRPPR